MLLSSIALGDDMKLRCDEGTRRIIDPLSQGILPSRPEYTWSTFQRRSTVWLHIVHVLNFWWGGSDLVMWRVVIRIMGVVWCFVFYSKHNGGRLTITWWSFMCNVTMLTLGGVVITCGYGLSHVVMCWSFVVCCRSLFSYVMIAIMYTHSCLLHACSRMDLGSAGKHPLCGSLCPWIQAE